MTFYEHLARLFLLILFQSSAYDSASVRRNINEDAISSKFTGDTSLKKSLFDGTEEKILEQEILQELNHMSSRKQREIFNYLQKQNGEFNASSKSLDLSEHENLSPLNVEELKTIRETISASNSSLAAIRNKRTLNFLLQAVARAMGYTLTPSNPDAEWIPGQQPPPAQPSPQPCSTPQPPCRPNPPPTAPPCPKSPPACGGSSAQMQLPTIPPNQIDANTIAYPYRPARTIPLFNFAPLPAGVRVPYPPLLQPSGSQRSSCPPQQPTPPPCGTTPAPSPPPCMTTPAPPCKPTSPPPPPCGTTPAPSPPPCMTTPAPPCKPTSPPPPPCGTTPAPSPPPCMTTPAPPCKTPKPTSPPCSTPAPPPQPCGTTAAPMPPPCGKQPPPPPPPQPSQPPKKGSIVLEYDDPVRIQIFSNGKKYLPASDSIYSGHDDVKNEDRHSFLIPGYENDKKEGEDYEEKEEVEEEHIEEEEEEDEPSAQLKENEDEDENSMANDEENESETSLSVVRKPVEQNTQKLNRRRFISLKTNSSIVKDSSKKGSREDNTEEESKEKTPKMKKPKKKKWVRIVKKQRRKTKTDSNPQNNFQHFSSDSFPESSHSVPKLYPKKDSFGFDSFERDVSDYSGDSSSHSSEDVTQIDLKKVIVNNKELNLPDTADSRSYGFDINPYALEPESERRKKLEKAVERYVENYVEKQLGQELIKNTGVPKTTVFEFKPHNGPKIQTITTTVAKTSTSGNPFNFKPKTVSSSNTPVRYPNAIRKNSYQHMFNEQGDATFDAYTLSK